MPICLTVIVIDHNDDSAPEVEIVTKLRSRSEEWSKVSNVTKSAMCRSFLKGSGVNAERGSPDELRLTCWVCE